MTIAELETISALLDLKKDILIKESVDKDFKIFATKREDLNLDFFNGKLTAYNIILVMIDRKIEKIREAAYSRDKKE